jgi:hypothetical protein
MIVGMMWCKNEGDILEEIVTAAASKVDALWIADGQSTDRSWDILHSLRKRIPNIEHVQQESEYRDHAQRKSLLRGIRERYRPEDTWVQVIESDVLILDTDVRAAIAEHAVADIGVPWIMLNAVRKPGTWAEVDTYPHWAMPMRELMPFAHWMELVLYTFRPLPELRFELDHWRPWPAGFSYYTKEPVKRMPVGRTAPLLLHVGYRGPKHFHAKYRHHGARHRKYRDWRVDSPENVERTVPFFNGAWNGNAFPASRAGWLEGKQ